MITHVDAKYFIVTCACPGWVENAKHSSSCCTFGSYVYVLKQNRLDSMEVTMLH